MSKYRKERTDDNQTQIVKDLRKLGISVEPQHDDILVGYNGRTLWVEIKTMDTWKKSGALKSGTFKDSQVGLLKEWKGDYMVAWTTDQILHELGIK